MSAELTAYACPVCGFGASIACTTAVITCNHSDRHSLRLRPGALMVKVTPLPLTDAKENA